MGRWIDRAAMTAITALVLYILFVSAFGSILLACCMSFLCSALLIGFRQRRHIKYKMTGFQAQAILENWAYGPDDDAEKQIQSLISHRTGTIVYLPKHPTATLSMGDVFSAWKQHRTADKIIVAAVCHSDGRARSFASTLQSPSVEIMDAARLIPIVRRSTIPPPAAVPGRQLASKLKNLLIELPGKRPWHRHMLIGFGLMLIYLITGVTAYLILSIGSLFIAGTALRMHA